MLNNNEMLNNVVEENLELTGDLMNLVDSVELENLEEEVDVDALFKQAEKDGAKLALMIAGGALVVYGGTLVYKKFISPKIKEFKENGENKNFLSALVKKKNKAEETENDIEENDLI